MSKQEYFVARNPGRNYLVSEWRGGPRIERKWSWCRAHQAEQFFTREEAASAVVEAYGSTVKHEVLTYFQARREECTHVYAHGRIGIYRFGYPAEQMHLWSIHRNVGKSGESYREHDTSIIVPESVAAGWDGKSFPGTWQYVEVYGEHLYDFNVEKIADAKPETLGFPFLFSEVLEAIS